MKIPTKDNIYKLEWLCGEMDDAVAGALDGATRFKDGHEKTLDECLISLDELGSLLAQAMHLAETLDTP
jgi:hypothetical protein